MYMGALCLLSDVAKPRWLTRTMPGTPSIFCYNIHAGSRIAQTTLLCFHRLTKLVCERTAPQIDGRV